MSGQLCLGLLIGVGLALASESATSEAPVTVSPSGSFVGSWMETRRGRSIKAYRGIRYAKSPTKELRFQEPQAILNYEGTVNATVEGPSCPQRTGNISDEDCLRLNVYTPGDTSSELLPVIVYIHSGAFFRFSGRSDYAGPHYLLEKDVVLVTINYRLGLLGFTSTGDCAAPGNVAFKDQVAALKWVQRNIAAFGGNPDLVTLAGCSAGSRSVGFHMVSPMSKGLFHRAIMISGSPISQAIIEKDQLFLAKRQAKLLGCSTDNVTVIMDCLKSKPWKEIASSVLGLFEFGNDPTQLLNAVIEPDCDQDRFLAEDPEDIIRDNRTNSVPLIISQTKDEFFMKAFDIQSNDTLLNLMNSKWHQVAPIAFNLPLDDDTNTKADTLKQAYLNGQDIKKDNATADGLGKLYADSTVGFAVNRFANLVIRHSEHPVYYYQFTYSGNHSFYENSTTKKPVGVAHLDDLIYLFTMPAAFDGYTVPLNSGDNEIVDKMIDIWYNFAIYGNPNPQNITETPALSNLSWPAVTPTSRQYLRIDKQFSVHENMIEDRLKVWEELYPIDY